MGINVFYDDDNRDGFFFQVLYVTSFLGNIFIACFHTVAKPPSLADSLLGLEREHTTICLLYIVTSC